MCLALKLFDSVKKGRSQELNKVDGFILQAVKQRLYGTLCFRSFPLTTLLINDYQ